MAIDTKTELAQDKQVYTKVLYEVKQGGTALLSAAYWLECAVKTSNNAIVFDHRTLNKIVETSRLIGIARALLEQAVGEIAHHPVLTTKTEG